MILKEIRKEESVVVMDTANGYAYAGKKGEVRPYKYRHLQGMPSTVDIDVEVEASTNPQKPNIFTVRESFDSTLFGIPGRKARNFVFSLGLIAAGYAIIDSGEGKTRQLKVKKLLPGDFIQGGYRRRKAK